VFLIVCITSTMIYAAFDAKVEINPSSTAVKPGDEVTFTIKVKDIVSENGANGIEGTISYDTDKFEAISDANVTKAGPWDIAYYNLKVIAEGLSAIKSDSDVINIKLKVKDDASLIGGTANFALNNIVVYNIEKVDLGTVSASVKIEGQSETTTPTPDSGNENTPTPDTGNESTPTPDTGNENTPTPDSGNENTPTPSTKPNTTGTPKPTTNPDNGENKNDVPITNINTNTSSGGNSTNKGNSSSGNTTIKGPTTSSSSLPKAGIGSTIAVLTVIVAVLGTISYIKLRKYREI